jgi:hypothetical protein
MEYRNGIKIQVGDIVDYNAFGNEWVRGLIEKIVETDEKALKIRVAKPFNTTLRAVKVKNVIFIGRKEDYEQESTQGK